MKYTTISLMVLFLGFALITMTSSINDVFAEEQNNYGDFTPLTKLSLDMGTKIYGMTIHNGYGYFVSVSDDIYKVKLDTQSIVATLRVPQMSSLNDLAFDSQNNVYISSHDDGVYKFDLDNIENNKFKSGVSVIVGQIDSILLSENERFMYVFGDYKFYEIELISSYPKTLFYTVTDETHGAESGLVEINGIIYFTDKDKDLILKYNPNGQQVTTVLDFHDVSNGITSRFPTAMTTDSENNLFIGCPIGSSQSSPPKSCTHIIHASTSGVVINQYTIPAIIAFEKFQFYPKYDIIYGVGLLAADSKTSIGYFGNISELVDNSNTASKKKGGSYNAPPTLGVDHNGKRFVDNGFSYNGNVTQADRYHTPYPLITTLVNQTNTIELIIYENGGINNIKWVQVALGIPEIGSPLNDAEVIAQLILQGGQREDLVVTDNLNLIQNFNATSIEPVKCKADYNTETCLKVVFEYEYREAPLYNVVAIDLMDTQRSAWTFYFNDGVEVLGESLNPADTLNISNKPSHHPQKSGILDLIQIDRKDQLWIDSHGYLWQGDESKMVLLSEIKYTAVEDKISEFHDSSYRYHSEFSNDMIGQAIVAEYLRDSMYGSFDEQDSKPVNDITYIPNEELDLLKTEFKLLKSELDARELLESMYPYLKSGQINNDIYQIREKIMVMQIIINWEEEE